MKIKLLGLSFLIVNICFANIFGPDNREIHFDSRVGQTSTHPCTAFFVSPRCIVTAGHCYRGVSQGFSFQSDESQSSFNINAINIGFEDSRKNDWAVYLSKEQYGSYFTLAQNLNSSSILVIGFPKDSKFSLISHDEKSELKGDKIYHWAATDLGNSGSPILSVDKEEVLGVHTWGGTDSNEGTSISHPNFNRTLNTCLDQSIL